MSLHDDIMNIPVTANMAEIGLKEHMITYKQGHKEARHAAAELALQAEEHIELLEQQLEKILDWLEDGDVEDSFADPIRKLLGRPLGHPAYN